MTLSQYNSLKLHLFLIVISKRGRSTLLKILDYLDNREKFDLRSANLIQARKVESLYLTKALFRFKYILYLPQNHKIHILKFVIKKFQKYSMTQHFFSQSTNVSSSQLKILETSESRCIGIGSTKPKSVFFYFRGQY